jgi:opacity protein-like surface antigen
MLLASGFAALGADSGTLTISADQGIWAGEVGDGFRAGAKHAGISAGAGVGMPVLGSQVGHDLALVNAHFGYVLSDVVAQDRWWRGNWELLGELFAGGQISPDNAYLVGGGPLLRYNVATGTRWVPFINGGGGVAATDIGEPDLSTTFQFQLQGGVGAHYFARENLAVTVEYRFIHISNAGIKFPNTGANTSMLCLGINWFF